MCPANEPPQRGGATESLRKRRPFDLYRSLLDTVPGADEAEQVHALRRHLVQPRDAWPAELRVRVDAADVSVGYLKRGLLSIHRFAPEVRTALEAGLPFAVARRVNGLPTTASV